MTDMEWHIAIGSQRYVARSMDDLRTWVREGRVRSYALVYYPPFERWIAAADVPELRPLFVQIGARSGPGTTAFILVALVAAVFLFVAVIGGRFSRPTHTEENVTPVVSAPSTISPGNDYQNGFAFGRQEGVDHANSGAGMPLPHGMAGMATLYAQGARPVDIDAWKSGFRDGFTTGFNSVKPFTRDASAWEQLSWSNARSGVRLYDYNEKHEATIQSVDRGSGLIVVRYTNGTVEPKRLNSVAPYWWIRRKR